MERINVVISDEAKRVLMDYKKAGNYKSQDDAMDSLLKGLRKGGENDV